MTAKDIVIASGSTVSGPLTPPAMTSLDHPLGGWLRTSNLAQWTHPVKGVGRKRERGQRTMTHTIVSGLAMPPLRAVHNGRVIAPADAGYDEAT
jgi:hypothetical protein